MPNTLSSTGSASAMAEDTEECWLLLVTIEHADLDAAIRVVQNNEDIVSRSNTFIAFDFEVDLPSETPDGVGEARLKMDNCDRVIVESLRTIQGPPTVTLEVILADSPDTVEISFPAMELRNATYDKISVEGSLRFKDILNEPVAETMTPFRFPGLH